MSDVILRVPDGDKCLSCMFLDVDYYHNYAKCLLFKDDLSFDMQYGSIESSSIKKCDRCPVHENQT